MRYILLASLAVSDLLFLILVNSFRIGSIANERWLYGETMCHLNAFFARYFYVNTLLHLIAVSCERYNAIVKSPLTHHGTITKSRVLFMALIWIIPIPLSIGPFFGFSGKYDYNPEVFFCDQGWTMQSNSSKRKAIFIVVSSLVIPFVTIVFLNWSVYRTAKTQIHALEVTDGRLAENKREELSTRKRERKAAVDVVVIITAFLLCFVPAWAAGICRHFKINVPAKVVLSTSCIYIVSAVCNPIIYSIRKREFRNAVKSVLRRTGLCTSSNNIGNNRP